MAKKENGVKIQNLDFHPGLSGINGRDARRHALALLWAAEEERAVEQGAGADPTRIESAGEAAGQDASHSALAQVVFFEASGQGEHSEVSVQDALLASSVLVGTWSEARAAEFHDGWARCGCQFERVAASGLWVVPVLLPL